MLGFFLPRAFTALRFADPPQSPDALQDDLIPGMVFRFQISRCNEAQHCQHACTLTCSDLLLAAVVPTSNEFQEPVSDVTTCLYG